MTKERIAEWREEAKRDGNFRILKCLSEIERLQTFDEKLEREKFEAWHFCRYGDVPCDEERRITWLAAVRVRTGEGK